MELQKHKCSFEDHKNIDAIKYCQECNIYLCNKCENHHSELFKNHHILPLEKDKDELFTGYCKEKSHSKLLNYFCKNFLNFSFYFFFIFINFFHIFFQIIF